MDNSNIPSLEYLDERLKVLFQLRLCAQTNLLSLLPTELLFEIAGQFYGEKVTMEIVDDRKEYIIFDRDIVRYFDVIFYTNFQGEKNGPYFIYHKNGCISEKFMYKDDKKEGEYRSYYEHKSINGRILPKWEDEVHTIGNYKNDQKNGKWVLFSMNGHNYCDGEYHNGKKIGDWNYYSQDGSLFQIYTYVDDQSVEVNEEDE